MKHFKALTNFRFLNSLKTSFFNCFWITVCLAIVMACQQPKNTVLYESDSLKIIKLSDRAYLHITYIDVPGYGPYGCNGLIIISDGEAAVFDTPTTEEVSNELINWIETERDAKVSTLVVNHFHDDCLGGIGAFHQRGIASYASQLTIDLAKKEGMEAPQNAFLAEQKLKVGTTFINNYFPGHAHAPGNIVSYIEEESLLFGGCMVKALGAGFGNLNDADTILWARTIRNVGRQFPQAEIVIPGHGKVGGTELLDYTINMFEKQE